MTNVELSVIIPVKDEEEAIPLCVERVRRVLDAQTVLLKGF